jgi:hypothetical protein
LRKTESGWAYFSMKNNYGWKDKMEVDQSVSGSIEVTFLDPDMERYGK